jgi:hypothetical protein
VVGHIPAAPPAALSSGVLCRHLRCLGKHRIHLNLLLIWFLCCPRDCRVISAHPQSTVVRLIPALASSLVSIVCCPGPLSTQKWTGQTVNSFPSRSGLRETDRGRDNRGCRLELKIGDPYE